MGLADMARCPYATGRHHVHELVLKSIELQAINPPYPPRVAALCCRSGSAELPCHRTVIGWKKMKHDTSFAVLTGNNIETRFIKAGGVIFREGDEAHELFVIKSGKVRIQLGNRTLADLSDNDIFGEMALIDDQPRS